ncbi:MAG: phosphoglucosamine mutase [Ruminococcus sp.]|nr:phosphoglucosamine mutase [Ruminococcus sp.]
MGRLFGKDGLKGLAVTELTCELAMQIGRAVAAVMANNAENSSIIVGKDTRGSADTLEAALCAGICSAGVNAVTIGKMPSPAVAYILKKKRACAGVMISYSQRKAEYNGFKIFSPEGFRISAETEEEIERLVLDTPWELNPEQKTVYGSIIPCKNAEDDYIECVTSKIKTDLTGVRVALDCGNGAASYTAERLFRELGAEVAVMGNNPDGANINKDCGCTAIEALMSFTKENSCDCGLAFDGGGERCIAVDEEGQIVDGDCITALCAKYLKELGKLKNNTLVVTPANNLGLTHFGYDFYMDVAVAGADERSLIKKLVSEELSIGGTPAGYILLPDESPVSDGQFIGARLLEILKNSERKMSVLASLLKKMPQVMINVPISRFDSEIWKNDSEITSLIEKCENTLGDNGRMLVREVGKEPVIKVLVEGKDFAQINSIAIEVAEKIKERCTHDVKE